MMVQSAVLTGDLVGSTKVGAGTVDQALDALRQAAWVIGGWTGEDARFTRYRGDGWQICLTRPGLALRATLMLTAALRRSESGLSTRLAIGIGLIEPPTGPDLSNATGAAFVLSGQALDRMGKQNRLTLASDHPARPWQAAILSLADWHIGQWTREQAEAVAMVLTRPADTQADQAGRLGITRQAFQARLAGSGFAAMQPALSAFEGQDHG